MKAAIIGYWRMGAKIETIMWLSGVSYHGIEKIIEDYQKKLKTDLT